MNADRWSDELLDRMRRERDPVADATVCRNLQEGRGRRRQRARHRRSTLCPPLETANSGEPEGNGVAERFIRTLKEQLLWVRTFDTVEELRQALLEFQTRITGSGCVSGTGIRRQRPSERERRDPGWPREGYHQSGVHETGGGTQDAAAGGAEEARQQASVDYRALRGFMAQASLAWMRSGFSYWRGWAEIYASHYPVIMQGLQAMTADPGRWQEARGS